MSREPEHQLDVADRAEARLATQYRGKQNITAIARIIGDACQEVEDLLHSIKTGLQLEHAVGAQLDMLGRIVGLAREDSPDDGVFRTRIAAQRAALRSSGSAESILKVFSLLLPTGHTFKLRPYRPAAIVLTIFGAVDASMATLATRYLQAAKAGGVDGQGIYSLHEPTSTFTLDVGPGLDVGHIGGIF